MDPVWGTTQNRKAMDLSKLKSAGRFLIFRSIGKSWINRYCSFCARRFRTGSKVASFKTMSLLGWRTTRKYLEFLKDRMRWVCHFRIQLTWTLTTWSCTNRSTVRIFAKLFLRCYRSWMKIFRRMCSLLTLTFDRMSKRSWMQSSTEGIYRFWIV